MANDFKEKLHHPQKFEENILKAFEKRKLVFFIGAGVSRIMGVPGWNDFSALLIKQAFPNYKEHSTILKEITDSKERITIAYNKFHSEGKLKEFYSCFGDNMKPNPEVFASKENIYEILNNFDATFLTTNADNLFEEVLGSALCHEECNVAILNNEHFKNQNHLFYLHGHYTDNININNNNLVFTASQYVKRYNNGDFLNFLRDIFQKDNIIIFVGYGLNEFELIDYIVTKSGYTKNFERKVYLLYGFCDNEEILYKAKSAYFEELNIGLIEYDISKNGYDSLINVLKDLLNDYRERTIVPVTNRITNCISNYTEEDYTEISRLLKNKHLAHTNEPQITNDILEQKNHIWVKRFYEDGFYSSDYLTEKIEYRAWPLLELLVEWVKSGDEDAQNAAVSFLSEINHEQIKKLSQSLTHINSSIIQMVFALNKSNIKAKHITLLKKIGERNNLYYYELPRIIDYSQVITWQKSITTKLLDVIFEKVNLETYQDNFSYSIKRFFENLNVYLDGKTFSKNLYEYLVDHILDASKPNTYCLFLRINDLDHIEKNHQELWTALFKEINFIFSKFDTKTQTEKIHHLIASENNASIKLGFYLARKFDHNVAAEILNVKYFSSYDYFHECYLLLKHLNKKQYFLEEHMDRLCEIVSTAKFGIDTYDNFEKDSSLVQLIESKQLLLLQLFPTSKCKKMVQSFVKNKVTPYPSEEIAESCDYVHTVELGADTYISYELFNDVEYKNWCVHFEKLCEEHVGHYTLSSCCRQFAHILMDQPEEIFSEVICNLKNIEKQLISPILYELKSNKDKLPSPVSLINSCLDILNEMQHTSNVDKQCAKSIFSTLADINIQDETVVKMLLDVVLSWLNTTIDDSRSFDDDNHVLSNLINFGDFDKITVLINSFITLKKTCNYTVTKKEICVLLDAIKNDNNNNTCKYTLCYYYQNLNYIVQQEYRVISDALLNENQPDIIALALCTLNSNYIFDELVNKIKSYYLHGTCSLPEACKDRLLSSGFYNYIIFSRYYNALTDEEFQKAYKDTNFLKHFLRNIHILVKKENVKLEEWLIPCWKYIKTNYTGDTLNEFADDTLHSLDNVIIPTKELLDFYLEVVDNCSERLHVYLDIPKVLPFFDVDAQKTAKLIHKIFNRDAYIKHEDLSLVITKYKEHVLTREASTLLNMLSERGIINTKSKEKLAQLLL